MIFSRLFDYGTSKSTWHEFIQWSFLTHKASSQKLMRFLPFYAQYGAPNGLGGLSIHNFGSLGNGECKGGQE